jgi:hypothetical protein
MLTYLGYDGAPRLTGSLALSIAYGIQADTPDNEFFRRFQAALEGMNEASVPGTFLVDVLPLRGSNPLSMDCERMLTDDGLPQSGIYLLGSPVCSSTRLQVNTGGICTRH